jgi:hypothetical protein
VDGHVTDLVEVGRDADDLAAGLVEIADRANVVARNCRRGCADAATFAQNVLVVSLGQVVLVQGREAALHHGSATGPYKHHVLAERIELLAIAGTKPFTDADQQEQGTDAPGNAEHGQERAQLVGPKRAKRLPENVENMPHRFII